MKRTVDIIIPVFNGDKFINEAIDSILKQSYQDFRILIVDDGSTDNTVSVVKKYLEKNKNILLFEQPHFGQPKTINRGLSETTAEFICFLDADDYWEETKLEKQLDYFDSNKDASACFTMIKEFESFEDNGVVQNYNARKNTMKGVSKTTIMFKRGLLELYNFFDEDQFIGVFINWFSKMIKDKIIYDTINEVLVHRRVHDTNFTKTINRMDYLQFLKKHLKSG
ncbi:glycosyltransferase [Polaribacter aquimarinus]|uniref:Glycosyltransferase 2-like domain-containing protein n=1 Tax=Polaribacter aquimarinus TaxID=2100726 RepID=A0A2U2JBS4_9FLAO|nr:glycosyltransferase [Polaribacter aquimarinus]PWG05796.1 hypothetical protein DIS07_04955 [Polaribacter aquimarinus]